MPYPIRDCECEDFPCCTHADNFPSEPDPYDYDDNFDAYHDDDEDRIPSRRETVIWQGRGSDGNDWRIVTRQDIRTLWHDAQYVVDGEWIQAAAFTNRAECDDYIHEVIPDDSDTYEYDDDSHLAMYDDDPNPYHGDYSEM